MRHDSHSEPLSFEFWFYVVLTVCFTGVAIYYLFFDKRSDVVPEALLYLIMACISLTNAFVGKDGIRKESS